jgi:predicted enzyme related to lactoylglutathione lyase
MANVTPDNSVVWFEIPVTDMKRAKSFYDAVFKTDLQEDNTGPNPMAVFPITNIGKGQSGHLYPGKPSAGGGNTVHLAAPAPLEDALTRVKENGGRIVSDIVSIPPGRFAYCLDPDGNSIGVFVHS